MIGLMINMVVRNAISIGLPMETRAAATRPGGCLSSSHTYEREAKCKGERYD